MVERPHTGRRHGICSVIDTHEGINGTLADRFRRVLRQVENAWSNEGFRGRYGLYYNGILRELNHATSGKRLHRGCDPHEDGRVAKLMEEPHGEEWHVTEKKIKDSLNARLGRLPKPNEEALGPEMLDRLFEATGWMNPLAADFVYTNVRSEHEAGELIEIMGEIGEGSQNPLVKRFCGAVANAARDWIDYSDMP